MLTIKPFEIIFALNSQNNTLHRLKNAIDAAIYVTDILVETNNQEKLNNIMTVKKDDDGIMNVQANLHPVENPILPVVESRVYAFIIYATEYLLQHVHQNQKPFDIQETMHEINDSIVQPWINKCTNLIHEIEALGELPVDEIMTQPIIKTLMLEVDDHMFVPLIDNTPEDMRISIQRSYNIKPEPLSTLLENANTSYKIMANQWRELLK